MTKAELAVRCAKAESLLHRLREHRVAAALDRGGDTNPLEMLYTIERFIDGHFNGSYWGDVRVYPNKEQDPDLYLLCEQAQGAAR